MALPRHVKTGYGLADFGISGALLVVQLYLFEYYTVVVGMTPLAVGMAMALAIIWDAVSDPLMGLIVDRTRTRLGRFLPHILGGGVLLPFALVLLFNPPSEMAAVSSFAYLLGAYVLVNTAITILGVPHLALGGALTEDSNERTEIYGWRLVFGTLGLLFGVGAPLIVAGIGQLDPSSAAGLAASRQGASVLIGGAILATVAVAVAMFWKAARALSAEASVGLSHWRSELSAVLRNRLFLPLLISFILVSLGRSMNGVLALPFYKYSLRLSEEVVQQWVLGVFALCIMGSVVIWVKLSKRYGKKWPGFAGMTTLGLMTMVAYPLFPQGDLTGPLLAAILGGVAVGAIILFESMVTDVADADRVATGDDREGVYFGFWRMGQKLSSSLGVLLTGWGLEIIGFAEGALTQAPEVERRLAWLFGPGVGIFFILGALVFARSPLNFAEQQRISEQVRALRSKNDDAP